MAGSRLTRDSPQNGTADLASLPPFNQKRASVTRTLVFLSNGCLFLSGRLAESRQPTHSGLANASPGDQLFWGLNFSDVKRFRIFHSALAVLARCNVVTRPWRAKKRVEFSPLHRDRDRAEVPGSSHALGRNHAEDGKREGRQWQVAVRAAAVSAAVFAANGYQLCAHRRESCRR